MTKCPLLKTTNSLLFLALIFTGQVCATEVDFSVSNPDIKCIDINGLVPDISGKYVTKHFVFVINNSMLNKRYYVSSDDASKQPVVFAPSFALFWRGTNSTKTGFNYVTGEKTCAPGTISYMPLSAKVLDSQLIKPSTSNVVMDNWTDKRGITFWVRPDQ